MSFQAFEPLYRREGKLEVKSTHLSIQTQNSGRFHDRETNLSWVSKDEER